MTIADIIGPMDVYPAFVAVGIGASITIMACTALVRPSNRQREIDFEIAKMKITNESETQSDYRRLQHEVELAKIGSSREIEFKRIDSGMIDVKNVR